MPARLTGIDWCAEKNEAEPEKTQNDRRCVPPNHWSALVLGIDCFFFVKIGAGFLIAKRLIQVLYRCYDLLAAKILIAQQHN